MASKTVVELFDDMDGGRADETVRFALDGVEYEIDLSAEHAASLRDTLAVYIGHAHRPASRAAKRAAADEERTDGPNRNGRAHNGRNGTAKLSGSASLTAEIRRLASESAQKVSQARIAEANDTRQDALTLDLAVEPPPSLPAEPVSQPTTAGPVPALVIPFLEAGL